jgi:hypothetical protein
MGLQSIDGRDPGRFDFTGTGAVPLLDADPANYEVETGVLNLSGLTTGEYTRLFGFVTPFGLAPPDFRTETLLDFSDTGAELAIRWGEDGETMAFSGISASALTLDLSAELRGAIKLGGPVIDVATLAGLQVVPGTGGTMTFAIAHRQSHEVENFSTFADFVAALDAALDGVTPALNLVASGSFDSPAGVFTTRRLLVVLGD